MADDNARAERYGKVIWETSRNDEGTISATGANIVARAVLALVDEEQAELREEREATWRLPSGRLHSRWHPEEYVDQLAAEEAAYGHPIAMEKVVRRRLVTDWQVLDAEGAQ